MRAASHRTRIYEEPGRIDAASWDALVAADPDSNPFLQHAYLDALHSSGAAIARTGWQPQYVTLWRGEDLVAAVPLYAKAHSYGEYVFDWSWAQAQERLGVPYYPKWLVAVPFTPVNGTRLIAVDADARRAAATALLDVARSQDLSSLHVLFAPPAQIELLAGEGLLVRTGLQFHWCNEDYGSFEDYLAALTQPRRKNVRAERRKVRDAGVVLERRSGADIREQDWNFFVSCYENTYAEHGSPPYLNLDFFLALGRNMPGNLMLVLALRDGRPVASALAVIDRDRSVLYGRYWGAVVHVPCLHFECCYYQMIEFAIEQRLRVLEGGAQGVHKLSRGLDPVPTQSAHWLREPQMRAAVARFVNSERRAVIATIDELNEHRALRSPLAACDNAGATQGPQT